MRSLTYDEFLAAANLSTQGLLTLRRRNHLSLAFGRREVFKGLHYLAVDAVGMLMADDLADSFARTFAAQLVRTHWDVWLAAVAHAEAKKEPWFFYVIEALDQRGRRSHFTYHAGLGASIDTVATLRAQLLNEGCKPLRIIATNISQIIERVRRNAAKAKIDLRAPFMWLPEDKRLTEIFKRHSEEKERVKAKVRRESDDDFAHRTGVLARAIVESGLHV